MNIRRVVLIGILFVMPLCIVLSQTHYLKGGKGKIWWTHDGKDVEGNVELDVNFIVISKKTSNGIVVDLGPWTAWPPPDSTNPFLFQLQIDTSRYQLGVYAIDAALNRSDTLWGDFYVYVRDTIPPSTPCGLTCAK